MAISGDYPRPITVNGFQCRNCDDVSDAKRNIDPAASKFLAESAPNSGAQSVTFGGILASRIPAVVVTSSETPARNVDRFA